MQFFDSIPLGMLLGAAVTMASTENAYIEVPSPDIASGVGIITYSGSGCGGSNQGTTLDYGGDSCVNWSNAGSFELQFGTLGGCSNGNTATIEFYHNTGCAGSTYGSGSLGGGCYDLNAVSGGHGSGLVIC